MSIVHDPKPMTCRQVAKVLQRFLDGELDDVTTEAVERHVDACRRCGLDAGVYREVKSSLARSAPAVPELALRRLREFGRRLADGEPAES